MSYINDTKNKWETKISVTILVNRVYEAQHERYMTIKMNTKSKRQKTNFIPP